LFLAMSKEVVDMVRYTKQFWMKHVVQQPASGLSVTQYCERNGIERKSFYNWQSKVRLLSQRASLAQALTRSSAEQPQRFVPVRIASSAIQAVPSSSACILQLGSGVRLEMVSLPTPDWLSAVTLAVSKGVN
jgi:Transposase